MFPATPQSLVCCAVAICARCSGSSPICASSSDSHPLSCCSAVLPCMLCVCHRETFRDPRISMRNVTLATRCFARLPLNAYRVSSFPYARDWPCSVLQQYEPSLSTPNPGGITSKEPWARGFCPAHKSTSSLRQRAARLCNYRHRPANRSQT